LDKKNNPLWLDARQWRVTLSNFGKVCNRLSSQSYPPSLVKPLLGDYGYPHTAALQWGCDHEADTIQQYAVFIGSEISLVAAKSHNLSMGSINNGLLLAGRTD